MNMKLDELKMLCDIAIEAAKAAGELIESYDISKLKVDQKKTGTSKRSQVVTEVDRLAESLILEKLKATQVKYDFRFTD